MTGDGVRFTVMVLISSLLFSCVVKSPRKGAGTTQSLKIQDIRVAEGADKTIVEIEGEGLMLFTSFQLSDPDRLILEISEVSLGKYRNEIKLTEGPVRSILPIPMDNIYVSRLEFELDDNVKTDVRPEGLNVVVEVTKIDDGADKQGMGGDGMGLKGEPMKDMNAKAMENTADGGMALPKGGAPTLGALPPPLVPVPSMGMDAEMMPDPMSPSPMNEKTEGEASQKPDAPGAMAAMKDLKETPVPTKKITGVRILEGNNLQVVVSLDGISTADVFYSDGKRRRIVIDLLGIKANAAQKNIAGDGRLVERIRTGKHPDKVRVVLDLIRPVEYSWNQSEGDFKMILKADPKVQSFMADSKSP